jgi:hypothetical protein
MLSGRRQRQLPVFALVWGVITILTTRQLQAFLLPAPVWFIVTACAIGLAGVSYAQAERGQALVMPLPDVVGRFPLWRRSDAEVAPASTLSGWSLLFVQMFKPIAMLSLASVVGVTLLRWGLPALDRLPQLAVGLAAAYVSVTGVVGVFIVRRWLGAFRVLQVLPMRDSSLALMMWASLIVPSFFACLAASAVHAVMPSWGLHIPYFMYPLFALVPLFFIPAAVESSAGASAAVHQWSPVIQIALWPLWAGAFSSMALTKVVPIWLSVLAIVVTIVCSAVGYWLVYSRVRSGAGLERAAGPLATR